MNAETTKPEPYVNCGRCMGRGYVPEARKSGRGFYARTCPRCSGYGSFLLSQAPKRERTEYESSR